MPKRFPVTASYSLYDGWEFETNVNYKLSETSTHPDSKGIDYPIRLAARPQVACEMLTGSTDVSGDQSVMPPTLGMGLSEHPRLTPTALPTWQLQNNPRASTLGC